MYPEGLWKYIGNDESLTKHSKRIEKTLLVIHGNRIQVITGRFRYGTYQQVFQPNILMTIEKDQYRKIRTGRILVRDLIHPIVFIAMEFTVKRNTIIVSKDTGEQKCS